MKEKPPKKLWLARLDFRHGGKWPADQTFYLNKPYFPEVAVPTKCHVLYESPLEAFVALHKEIMQTIKKVKPYKLQVFVYSVIPVLLNRGSYHSPESYQDKDLFVNDRSLIRRHLIRQSCVFTREANLEISYGQFDKEPLLDLFFTDETDKEKYLMTLRKPKVSMTFGSFAKYQNKSVEQAIFNFDDFQFLRPISLKEHDPKNLEKLNASKCNLAST